MKLPKEGSLVSMKVKPDLSSLKAGDKVLVNTGYGRVNSIRVVERITKTQIILKDFWCRVNKNGRAIGRHGYDVPHIYIPEQKDIDEIRHRTMYAKVRGWFEEHMPEDMESEQLKKIYDIMKETMRSMYQDV